MSGKASKTTMAAVRFMMSVSEMLRLGKRIDAF
jgi:hypothetical protein